MTQQRMDRRLVALVVISTLLLVGGVASVLYYGPKLLSSEEASVSVQRGTDLSNCRAGYSAAVTDQTTALARDNADLTRVKSQLDVMSSRLVRAIALRDDTQVQTILGQMKPIEDQVEAAAAHVLGDEAGVDTANKAYQAAIQQAQHDPDAFIQRCRDEG